MYFLRHFGVYLFQKLEFVQRLQLLHRFQSFFVKYLLFLLTILRLLLLLLLLFLLIIVVLQVFLACLNRNIIQKCLQVIVRSTDYNWHFTSLSNVLYALHSLLEVFISVVCCLLQIKTVNHMMFGFLLLLSCRFRCQNICISVHLLAVTAYNLAINQICHLQTQTCLSHSCRPNNKNNQIPLHFFYKNLQTQLFLSEINYNLFTNYNFSKYLIYVLTLHLKSNLNKNYFKTIKMNKETKLVKNQIRNPQITSQILHQKQKSSPQLTLNMPINRRFTLSFTPKNQLQETTIQSPRTQEKQKDNFFGSPSLSVQKNNSTSNLFSNCKDEKIITLNKFYSFKKIRQLKTKQKNDQGKVISQIRIDSQNIRISPQVKMDQIKKKPNLKQRITDLNEARTISSNYSPRSSNHSGMIVESQIICKGHQVFYDFDEGEAFNKNFQLGQFGFKRRNNIEKVRHPQLDLLISKQLGWLCHYQIQEHPIDKDTIELLRIVDEKQANTWHFNQGILSLYAQHPIKNQEQQFFYRQKNRKPLNAKKKYLLIYQPYEMEFQKFIRKCENLYFSDIIKFLGQLINQLRFIRDRTRSANISVAPIVRMEYLVISADRVKIKIQKLRMVCPQSSCISQFVKNSYGSPFVQKHSRASSYYENSFQKQVLKDIGMVGYQIVNCLRVDHQKRSYNIRQLSRQTKIRFNNLMQDLISGDCDYALEEALSKMQILMGL